MSYQLISNFLFHEALLQSLFLQFQCYEELVNYVPFNIQHTFQIKTLVFCNFINQLINLKYQYISSSLIRSYLLLRLKFDLIPHLYSINRFLYSH